jgi:pimeloyl-ACP methyl ester carboxylesterase
LIFSSSTFEARLIDLNLGEEPFEYRFENIQVPTAIITAQRDTISVPEDLEVMTSSIPNLIGVETYDYEHLSFMIGRYMGYLNDVEAILRAYSFPQSA